MMPRSLITIVKICVLVLFVTSVCLVVSCKKSPPEGQPSDQRPQPSSTSSGPKTPETPKVDTGKPPKPPAETPTAKAPEQPKAPKEVKTPAGSDTGSSVLAAVDIKLPKPMFVGTPQDTRVPNLEKPSGKPRPPFLAPPGTKNLALGKPVKSSDEEPIIGEIEMITDGDKEAADGSYVELGPFLQHVTIDLGAKQEIYAIVVWHYHKQPCVYFDVVAQVADDADFITNVKTVFNNDADNSAGLGVGKNMHYTETAEGKLIDCMPGVRGRYVRLYSNGNTSNDLNHYIEVDVYGKPVE
jgi:hypothetical protein